MKRISWTLLTFTLAFAPPTFALPDTLSCHGLDQYGNRVDAFIDLDTGTARINGNYLTITPGERGLNIPTTDNFRNENGVLVYASVLIDDRYVRINQYDACHHDFIVSAELCCRKHITE